MSVTFSVPLPPDMNKFYLDIITDLRRELNQALGKLDVYERLVEEYIKIVPGFVSTAILNRIDVNGQLPEAHDAIASPPGEEPQ
jgi:hypothetical protein